MPSKIATAGVDKAHAATYFRKSRQLCEAASAELDADRSDASLILAIHAGISAADAVSIGVGTRKKQGVPRACRRSARASGRSRR